ncbi:MAG: hypothetical protein ACFFAU_10250 [Candidatus Hodarchaeota archaeon]
MGKTFLFFFFIILGIPSICIYNENYINNIVEESYIKKSIFPKNLSFNKNIKPIIKEEWLKPSILSELSFGTRETLLDVFSTKSNIYLLKNDKLEIIDVSNPTNPIKIGEYNFSSSTNRYGTPLSDISSSTWNNNVFVVANTAYITTGSLGGLLILDVANPSSISENSFLNPRLSTYPDPCFESRVMVSGNMAYTVDRYNGLLLIDITDPSDPQIISTLAYGGNRDLTLDIDRYDAKDVYEYNGIVYIADHNLGLRSIDVSNPYNPTQLDHIGIGPGYVNDVHVFDNFAYVAHDYGLFVLNVINPYNLQKITNHTNSGGFKRIHIVENKVFLAGDRLVIFDISNPTNPIKIGEYGEEELFWGLSFSESSELTFLTYSPRDSPNRHQMEILDLTNPSIPSRKGIYAENGFSYNVFVKENVTYVANSYNGLEIIDIQDPISPQKLSQFDDGGFAHDVVVIDGIAYIADGNHGLEIIDVNNVNQPFKVESFYESNCYMNEIEIHDNLAFIASGYNGLLILDVTDHSNPLKIGNFTGGDGYTLGISVQNKIGFIAEREGGLKIVNVTNPNNPVLISFYSESINAQNVYIKQNIAYLADGEAGLKIVDISDLTNPIKLSEYNDGNGFASRVYVEDNVAYLADGENGLRMIDVSNLLQPSLFGEISSNSNSQGLFFSENLVFVADGTWGIKIVDNGYDSDEDKLSDVQEKYIYRTNSFDNDTDKDFLSDGAEVLNYRTDPLDEDSDKDGILDGQEVFIYYSNPLSTDSDNDTMPDFFEFQNGLDLINNDSQLDKDGDGIPNLYEFIHGLNVTYNDSAEDKDLDGIPNGWEAKYDLSASDPTDANLDPDADGLSNYEEFQIGTNPRNMDTDGDGALDNVDPNPTEPRVIDFIAGPTWMAIILLISTTFVLFIGITIITKNLFTRLAEWWSK